MADDKSWLLQSSLNPVPPSLPRPPIAPAWSPLCFSNGYFCTHGQKPSSFLRALAASSPPSPWEMWTLYLPLAKGEPCIYSLCLPGYCSGLKFLDHSQTYTPKKYDRFFKWFFQNSLHWFDTNRKTSFPNPMGEIHNTFTYCFKVITTFFSMEGFILYNWMWVIGWTV